MTWTCQYCRVGRKAFVFGASRCARAAAKANRYPRMITSKEFKFSSLDKTHKTVMGKSYFLKPDAFIFVVLLCSDLFIGANCFVILG